MSETLSARRAIESLRSGVPSREVAEYFGTNQNEIMATVEAASNALERSFEESTSQEGFVLRGRFGSGKSHLLKCIERRALSAGFACSTLSVSKEMPLGDLEQCYSACVRAITLPDRLGGDLAEVALKLDFDSPAYSAFYRYVQDSRHRIDPLFQATLELFEHGRTDRAFLDEIVSFWGGAPVKITELRRHLRAASIQAEALSRKVADPMDRFRFTGRLLRAAGYKGWLIFFDEVELIAKFAFKARAKAYISIARLASLTKQRGVPGLLTLFATTPDLHSLLTGTRRDDEKLDQVRDRWGDEFASDALLGLRLLGSTERQLNISRPSPGELSRIQDCAWRLYQLSYGSARLRRPEKLDEENFRTHVRGLITLWDLDRLNVDYIPSLETFDIRENLDEDASYEPDAVDTSTEDKREALG